MPRRGDKRSRAPKRGPAEMDELAIAVATLHYERNLGHDLVAAELRSEGRDVRDPRDVRKLLARAHERALVSVSVMPRAVPPPRDETLGRRLARAIGVRNAVVVVTDLGADESHRSTDPDRRAQARRESNELHSLLGAAAAEHLWERLRSEDRIAVGGGRGPAHTVAALGRLRAERDPAYADQHVVLSLGGVRLTSAHSPGVEMPAADYNASCLANIIVEGEVDAQNVRLCRLPSFLDEDHRDTLMKRIAPHLRGSPSRPLEADVAVFGGGVIDHAHELMVLGDPQYEEIKDELVQLRKLIDGGCEAPVINFCDVFYPGPSVPEKKQKLVERIVAGLNSKAVTIAPEKLEPVHEKILVAGGHQKLPMLSVLTAADWQGLRPTTLVTDQATARGLLASP